MSNDPVPEPPKTKRRPIHVPTPAEINGTAPGSPPIAGTRKWARSKGLPVDGPESED